MLSVLRPLLPLLTVVVVHDADVYLSICIYICLYVCLYVLDALAIDRPIVETTRALSVRVLTEQNLSLTVK